MQILARSDDFSRLGKKATKVATTKFSSTESTCFVV